MDLHHHCKCEFVTTPSCIVIIGATSAGAVDSSGGWIEVKLGNLFTSACLKTLETEPELARQGLECIGTLFSLECQYGTWPPKKKLQLWRERAGSLVENFYLVREGAGAGSG